MFYLFFFWSAPSGSVTIYQPAEPVECFASVSSVFVAPFLGPPKVRILVANIAADNPLSGLLF